MKRTGSLSLASELLAPVGWIEILEAPRGRCWSRPSIPEGSDFLRRGPSFTRLLTTQTSLSSGERRACHLGAGPRPAARDKGVSDRRGGRFTDASVHARGRTAFPIASSDQDLLTLTSQIVPAWFRRMVAFDVLPVNQV